MAPRPAPTGILVGGRWLASDVPLPVRDPATRRVVRRAWAADASVVDAAVGAAAEALPAWSARPVEERRLVLARLAGGLGRREEPLARLLTREQGKPLAESRREVRHAAATFAFYASLPFEEEVVRDDERARVSVRAEHAGVCALLLPWNYPVAIMAWKLAPCLLAGDTCVVKPSEFTPLADSAVAAVADGLLPPGVVNLVSGGAGAGRALAGHPGVALVSLTGGEGTGRAVAAAAGGSLRRAVLELGGNDAAVVLPSAEPARVASRLLWGAMRNAGQVCVAIKRLYLHERIAGEVIERMVAEARSIRLGHGLDEATQMGPVNNPPMLERVGSLVEEARAEGGKVVCGGAPPRVQGLESGLFYSPTIVAGLDERSRLVSEEHFGPVLAALTFSDEDEAVRRANSTGHGLGASVWGADVRRARGLASRLRAGTVWVNSHAGIDVAAPFGGMGRSGLGRELGRWGLEPYVQWKTVSEAKGPA